MTRQPISTIRQLLLHYLTRSVRRTRGFVLADHPDSLFCINSVTSGPSSDYSAPVFQSVSVEIAGAR
jgi:hypothetical protein